MAAIETVLEHDDPSTQRGKPSAPRLPDPAGQLRHLRRRFPSTRDWQELGPDRWQGLDGGGLYRWVMFDPIAGRLAHTNGDRATFDDLPPSPATPATFAFFRLGRELDRAAAADPPVVLDIVNGTPDAAGHTIPGTLVPLAEEPASYTPDACGGR